MRNKSEESIPDKIGKGDDAKNSVVWHVITYSLTIYSCIVAALLVIDVFSNGGQSALNIVKDSWAVFTPIITLSLGYMFGKKEDDSFKKTLHQRLKFKQLMPKIYTCKYNLSSAKVVILKCSLSGNFN